MWTKIWDRKPDAQFQKLEEKQGNQNYSPWGIFLLLFIFSEVSFTSSMACLFAIDVTLAKLQKCSAILLDQPLFFFALILDYYFAFIQASYFQLKQKSRVIISH